MNLKEMSDKQYVIENLCPNFKIVTHSELETFLNNSEHDHLTDCNCGSRAGRRTRSRKVKSILKNMAYLTFSQQNFDFGLFLETGEKETVQKKRGFDRIHISNVTPKMLEMNIQRRMNLTRIDMLRLLKELRELAKSSEWKVQTQRLMSFIERKIA